MKWLIRLFPWPGKDERRAAIDAARAEKHQSRERAARAKVVERDIRDLYEQNRWAVHVADALGIDRGEGKR